MAGNPASATSIGMIRSVAGVGSIAGSIHAIERIDEVHAGDAITAAISAPFVGSVIEDDDTWAATQIPPTIPASVLADILADAAAAKADVLTDKAELDAAFALGVANFNTSKAETAADIAEAKTDAVAAVNETKAAAQAARDQAVFKVNDAFIELQKAAAEELKQIVAMIFQMENGLNEQIEALRTQRDSDYAVSLIQALDIYLKLLVADVQMDQQRDQVIADVERKVEQRESHAHEKFRALMASGGPSAADAFWNSIGNGVWQFYSVAEEMVKQTGMQAWDTIWVAWDAYIFDTHYQVKSDLGKAIESGQITAGEFYVHTAKELALTVGTLGMYNVAGIVNTNYRYLNGELTDEEYRALVAQDAFSLLLFATSLKGTRVGTAPLRQVPREAAATARDALAAIKKAGVEVWKDESGAVPIPPRIDPTLAERRIHHDTIVKDISNQLKQDGYQVKRTGARFYDENGVEYMVADIFALRPVGTPVIFEIKTGNASLTGPQKRIYHEIVSGNAIPSRSVAKLLGIDSKIPLNQQGFLNGIQVFGIFAPGL